VLFALGAAWLAFLWMNYMDSAMFWLRMLFICFLPLAAVWQRAENQARLGGSDKPEYVYAPSLALLIGVCSLVLASVLPQQVPPLEFHEVARWIESRIPQVSEWRGGGGGSSRYSLGEAGYGASPRELGGPVETSDAAVFTISVTPDFASPIYIRGEVWVTYTGRGWENPEEQYRLSSAQTLDLPRDYVLAGSTPVEVVIEPENPLRTVYTITEPVRLVGLQGNVYTDSVGNYWLGRASRRSYRVLSLMPTVGDRQPSLERPEDMSQYLYVPISVTGRIYAMVERITREASDPWDKAKQIESALRSYSYNTEPPPTPEGRDFVDYFVFDLKKGYCTYHSTALAVMCRIAGIPTRWVTGYVAPSGQGARTVKYNMAHAWVEAFIEPYGWVTLEATPPFILPWRELVASGGADQDDTPVASHVPIGEFHEDLMHDLFDEYFGGPVGSPTAKSVPTPAIVLGILLLVLLARLGYSVLHWRKMVRESTGVASLYTLCTRMLEAAGFGRNLAETPREYLVRLGDSWPEAAEVMHRLTPLFENQYYGGVPQTEVHLDSKQVCSTMRRLASRRTGPLRYVLRVYLLPAPRQR